MPEVDVEIAAKLRGQLANLPPPFEGDGEAATDGIARLLKAVKELRVGTGPADEVAYYDFHSLWLALPHVWRDTYGPDVANRLREFYEAWDVALDPWEGVDPALEGEGPEDWEQLEADLRRAEDDIDAFETTVPTVPPLEFTYDDGTKGLVDQDAAAWLFQPGRWASMDPNARQFVSNEYHRRNGYFLRAAVDLPRGLGGIDAHDRASELREHLQRELAHYRAEVDRAVTAAEGERERERRASTDGVSPAFERLRKTIKDLRARRQEDFRFDVFAPQTVNFGLLVTYRQEWRPDVYQVGDLVATLPLAPGETRKITAKEVIKTSRSRKEVEKALSSRRGESETKSRAEAEITKRASLKTNFQNTSGGQFGIEGMSANTSTTYGLESGRESARAKKSFREAVRKAAEEFTSERTVEVTSSSDDTTETTTSGEISNPNNEVTVTYLFYELQRRYELRENLRKITPVILVAMPVPHPTEIDEDWLIAHEWILRRVLLDDSLQVALDYVTDGLAGDELAVQVLRDQWVTARGLVQRLEGQVEAHVTNRGQARQGLQSALARSGTQGVFEDIGEFLFGGTDDSDAGQARVEAAERALEFLESDLAQARSRLGAASEHLQQATEKLVGALRAQVNRRISVDQLLVHIRDNILYYMHAIWDHEPPDQRYFRIYNWKVPFEEVSDRDRVTFRRPSGSEAEDIRDPFTRRSEDLERLDGAVETEEPPDGHRWDALTLGEVADLDNPLGYKGNYMIFPLSKAHRLTAMMSLDFVDTVYGLRDPDPGARVTISSLLLRMEAAIAVDDRDMYDDALALLTAKLTRPDRATDTIVVPSGQLFIEALPGDHSVLENFKLLHRAMDVTKVQAEVRGEEIENLRKAARILAADHGDPDVDRYVHVDGPADVVVEP